MASLIQSDGKSIPLPFDNDPIAAQRLVDRRWQTGEMIDQINRRKYYEQFFAGKKGLLFVDLGANLGLVSLYALPACRRIIAVEPEPRTYETLALLTKPFRDRIDCLAVAISSQTGKVDLAVDLGDNTCHTTVNKKPGCGCVTVPALNFPDLWNEMKPGPVDVCKVDIEGAEMEALTADVIDQLKVKAWYIEVHKTPIQSREKSLELMSNRMQCCGFTVTIPRPNAIVAIMPDSSWGDAVPSP